jgi:hydrogenase maturation protease
MGNLSGKSDNAGMGATHIPTTLILGLGNPLRGDDGVGVYVARQLLECCLPNDVEVADGGTQGLGLVTLLEGRRRVIVVDAADMERLPGEFVRFGPEEARLLAEDGGRFSVHQAGLRETLLLAQALGLLPEEVVIFGVQPAGIEWEAGLSPAVETALPGLVEAVLDEVMAGDLPLRELGAGGIEPAMDRSRL